jgi:hypothetical protein
MIGVPLATIGLMLLARATLAQGLPFGVPASPTDARAGPVTEVTLRLGGGLAGALEILRFVRVDGKPGWRLADTTPTIVDGAHLATVAGPSGVQTLLAIRRPAGDGYVLEGPFVWPAAPQSRDVSIEWRRTIRGSFGGERAPIVWVDATREAIVSPWPACDWQAQDRWECVGVPRGAAGAVVITRPGAVGFGLLSNRSGETGAGIVSLPIERAEWGRLVLVSRQAAPAGAGSFHAVARRVAAASGRRQATRLDVENDPRVHVSGVGARAFWISGNDASGGGWVEFGAPGAAPERVETRDLVSGPADLPLIVRLTEAVAISGRVVTSDGVAAPDAVVALYRVVDGGGGGAPPRRIAAGELRSGASGEFSFEDVGSNRYQILAMHSTFGRGERAVEGGERDLEIRLRAPPQIVGRVTRNGSAASGVAVVVVPDIAQFAASVDVTELRGGEGRSDRDGRFRVAAAMRGAGELRIGDERAGVRRIALPPAESLPPLVDVGTVDLAETVRVTLVLEGSDGCELLLTGPAGRLGLTTSRARRVGPAMYEANVPEPGSWHIVALCGADERPVVPPVIQLVPGGFPPSIRLTWPFG